MTPTALSGAPPWLNMGQLVFPAVTVANVTFGGAPQTVTLWKTMGKPWENGHLYGKSPFLMGKSTISMAVFQ
jgi:hypothetical protein